MTPEQCRAARALLDWSQQQLAEAANVGNATIRNFEATRSLPQSATLDAMRQAFDAASIEFTNGDNPGVRFRAEISDELLLQNLADGLIWLIHGAPYFVDHEGSLATALKKARELTVAGKKVLSLKALDGRVIRKPQIERLWSHIGIA